MNEKLYQPESKIHLDLAKAELQKFLGNPGLDQLASLFKTNELPTNTTEKLAELQKLASEHWDFRKGADRQEVNWDNELLDDPNSEQWKTVFSASEKLGIVQSSEPINKNPSSLVILGGANRSPYDRLKYGLESVEDFDRIAFLGSSRIVSDAEREKIADFAPNAQTEFDIGSGAFENLLAARKIDEHVIERGGDTWGMKVYEFERNGKPITGFVLSTPQIIGERRANTYDNYSFFADRAELATDPSHSIVAVTTGFYINGQHLPAVQELTLPYGTSFETIGHSAEYSSATRKPSQLLQETKAAIDSAVRLNDTISKY